MHKCYIALFTCANTRALHLELTPDLSANSFLRVLKRFFSRRGLPTLFISDNGRTFRDSKVKKFALDRNIDWKFNVPTASWWGGFFEICEKLVKRCLNVLSNLGAWRGVRCACSRYVVPVLDKLCLFSMRCACRYWAVPVLDMSRCLFPMRCACPLYVTVPVPNALCLPPLSCACPRYVVPSLLCLSLLESEF